MGVVGARRGGLLGLYMGEEHGGDGGGWVGWGEGCVFGDIEFEFGVAVLGRRVVCGGLGGLLGRLSGLRGSPWILDLGGETGRTLRGGRPGRIEVAFGGLE